MDFLFIIKNILRYLIVIILNLSSHNLIESISNSEYFHDMLHYFIEDLFQKRTGWGLALLYSRRRSELRHRIDYYRIDYGYIKSECNDMSWHFCGHTSSFGITKKKWLRKETRDIRFRKCAELFSRRLKKNTDRIKSCTERTSQSMPATPSSDGWKCGVPRSETGVSITAAALVRVR